MVASAWIYLNESFALQLFSVSVVTLAFGIVQKVWADAWHLSFLESTSLRTIEREHPHLPSRKVITCIFLCSAALLIVSAQTLMGTPLFSGPFAWMQLAGFFMLAGSAGTLAELRWKGTRDIAFACITGSALAFITMIWRFAADTHLWGLTLLHAVLLLLCLLLAWRLLFRQWSTGVQSTAVGIFALWMLLNY